MTAAMPHLPLPLIRDAVRQALIEDLGRAGDITTLATVAPDAEARLVIRGRAAGVVAGMPLVEAAFHEMDPAISVRRHIAEGERVAKGTVVVTVHGNAQAILSAERVALNYIGRLSGIATATRAFADRIAHTRARITCTRKTTPGLRAFEKYAVRCGGGSNHRFGLDDAILIKDNHIAVCGSVVEAIRRARAYAGHLIKLEVEVDTLDQLRAALTAGPDVVLLDNMPPALLKQAVEITAGEAILEASGGVTLETVAAIAETGVDYISSGWITHSAPVLDLGLDIAVD